MTQRNLSLAIDIGGTFTDIVAADGARFIDQEKILSTPEDYSLAIQEGLKQLFARAGIAPSEICLVVHGTTIATNAIIEGRGAKTALLATEGFADVLELRRMRVPELYNFYYEKPSPLVPRRRRYEARERMAADGRVITPLDLDRLRNTLQEVAAQNVDALAICFLHAYANGIHEQRAHEEAQRILGDKVYITSSHRILPEIREYERTSTTVLNAYVAPVVRAYLMRIVEVLTELGVTAPLRIMQSNGGVLGVEAVLRIPATIVESGPAAGVVGGAMITRRLTPSNAITIDMGGTTAKASLIEDGQVIKTSEYEVGSGINVSSQLVKGRGHALRLPVIDVSEIGAGGGSLAKVDATGRLRVGPESAGAAPGPACYGRGGKVATLTDAMVILGYISDVGLAGGTVPVDRRLAELVILEQIAQPLKTDVLAAAHGIYLVAAAVMTRAVKAVTTYRGRDPRDFALVAFGGNGALMAPQIADSLQMKRIIVPPLPGVFSACGLLVAPTEREMARTIFERLTEISEHQLKTWLLDLADTAIQQLLDDGCRRKLITVCYRADLRYAGQAYELTVPIGPSPSGTFSTNKLARAFHDEHERTYGHSAAGEPVVLVSVRVVAQEPAPIAEMPRIALSPESPFSSSRTRQLYFGRDYGHHQTSILGRGALRSAGVLSGPLVVEEYDATTLVPPLWQARVDADLNIVLDRMEGRDGRA
ncbi:MAG: hydantoinase/oxoprolinase family protein [Acidobacteria bacterium]|nr:hydantoinase/oxoprolinase family protein [Acidobacteriota bacterium]